MRWPIGIALGLLLVVLVDFTFIWVATQNAPTIAPSYEHGER